jgi:hypothetical protein
MFKVFVDQFTPVESVGPMVANEESQDVNHESKDCYFTSKE